MHQRTFHERCLPVERHVLERHVLEAVRLKEQITQNTHEEWLQEYGRNKRLSSKRLKIYKIGRTAATMKRKWWPVRVSGGHTYLDI